MAEPGEPLSERELDVLRCVSSGASNKEIASDLSISENTVKVHLRNIYAKLAVSSRTEATTAAMQQGYIAVPGQPDTAESDAILSSSPSAEQVTGSAIAVPAAGQEALSIAPREEDRSANWWRSPVLIALLLAGIALAAFLGWQMLRPTTAVAPPAAELFAETTIENTRWLQSRPMPEGRANMATAAVGLDVYQIGGETGAGVDGIVRAFNSRDLTWRDMADKPTPVADAEAAELYGEIYVAGGRLADGRLTAAVEAYSPTQNAWRPIAALPSPLSGSLVLSDGSFLYVIGGSDGDSFLDTAYQYDPAADSWRPLPPLPGARAFASGGTLTGRLYVVGGRDENGALDDCRRFDPATESWAPCPPMLKARAGAGSAVLLNRLYVIGGSAENGGVDFSEMYDPTSETWQVINTPLLAESSGWPDLGVGQVETRIYALGGRQGEAYLDDTLVFAPLVYQTYIPAASSADSE
jgi:DNA-binding CsgD family transcriptional regulator/N-acetylneuraminic acid mutarotase